MVQLKNLTVRARAERDPLMFAVKQGTQAFVQTDNGCLYLTIADLLNEVHVSERGKIRDNESPAHIEEDLFVLDRLLESEGLLRTLLQLQEGLI